MTTLEFAEMLDQRLPALMAGARRVLLIVPDTTRTAPVAELVRLILPRLADLGLRADVLIALGTHPPLPEQALRRHVGVPDDGRLPPGFEGVRLLNHAWNDPARLVKVGTLSPDDIASLTGGMMKEKVELTLNREVLDHDRLLILGPVFPHEIAGFSGGSKYLFPGISGPEIIDFFHWLGAVITNLRIIGIPDNPVRRVLDAAAARVPVPVSAISFVTHGGGLAFAAAGPVVESWRAAVEHSLRLHVVRKPRKFRRVLSCCPAMYEDLWTGGKCMYKVEPVVEDGGEVVIYAPHVDSLSVVHGRVIERIGYHVKDYFLQHRDRFADVPRASMAVATYIKGSGTYENGVETPRIRVTVASRIPRATLERAGLGWADVNTIRLDEWRGREDEGILLVERAGETLYLPA